MTSVEKDMRNRTRGLGAARDALASGDAQGAANALAGALSAQRALDGGVQAPVADLAPSEQPARDFTVSPSDLATAMSRMEYINQQRAQGGLPPITVDVSRQRHRDPSDPIMAWETANVRISGASQAELDAFSLGNVRSDAERRVSTAEVLSAAAAATRINGGRYVSTSESSDSIPAQVNAYVNDKPGGPHRARLSPTAMDRERAVQVRIWARTQQPTTDYLRALRHSVSDEYMGLREAGTASSAIAGFQRFRARQERVVEEQRKADAAARAQGRPLSHEPNVISPRPGGSRWLGQKGQKVTVVAEVEKAVPVMYEGHRHPHYLYVMRTPDGDLVRWMATSGQGMREGHTVTLQGTIKGHSEWKGEKQTEMFYCKPRIHV